MLGYILHNSNLGNGADGRHEPSHGNHDPCEPGVGAMLDGPQDGGQSVMSEYYIRLWMGLA